MAVKISAKVDGINDLLRNIDVTVNKFITAQAAGVASVCIDVANHAKENHSFQNRTGNLEASIQPEPVEINGDLVEGKVIAVGNEAAGMEYAAYVEFGTPRSAPYPYMQPALDANHDNLITTLAAVNQRAGRAVKVEK